MSMMIWNPWELALLEERNRIRAPSVLVVEDDLLLRRPLTCTLREVNFETRVRWVTSCTEARLALLEEKPDLIISDCLLDEGGTGIDFWSHCRDTCPQIPFVMMTGLTRESLTKLARSQRGTEALPVVLEKPIRISEYRRQLRRFLEY